MSLRRRLLLIVGLIATTWVVASVVIVATQRNLMISQIDEQLQALPPGAVSNLNQPTNPAPGGGIAATAPVSDSPFSAISVGEVDTDGRVRLLFMGDMTSDIPDFTAAIGEAPSMTTYLTIGSLEGGTSFRARIMPQPESGAVLVVAHPLTEVEAAITRLERTLAFAGLVVAVMLGLGYLWIQRLGLRPIARVTDVARAISAGDRTRRVPAASPGTEAEQLGRAINVMLDERDASEERLRQFVADASHELRTPLTSVRGYLDLYQQGAFRQPGQLDDVVRRLAGEAQRMSALVDDMLVLASLDEGRPLTLEPVDIGQLFADAAQDARATQPEREVVVDIPPQGLKTLADEGLLAQLIGILVANALAHTPPTARITLSGAITDHGVSLTVADTGPGMDPAMASRVFDRFWRGTTGRSRASGDGPSGSAGLGLAIARSIVERHGGTISLDAPKGVGSTFSIHLPTSQPEDGPSIPHSTGQIERFD